MKKVFMKMGAVVAFFTSIVLGVNENPATWWTILIAIPLAIVSLVLLTKINRLNKEKKQK